MTVEERLSKVEVEVRELSKIIKMDLYKRQLVEAGDHHKSVWMAIASYESRLKVEGMGADDFRVLESMQEELKKAKVAMVEKERQYKDACKL